jgi:hypothetical protein
MKTANTYPGFDYEASQILKFLPAYNFISLMLKDSQIIHFIPPDKDAFIQWLLAHGVENIRRTSNI